MWLVGVGQVRAGGYLANEVGTKRRSGRRDGVCVVWERGTRGQNGASGQGGILWPSVNETRAEWFAARLAITPAGFPLIAGNFHGQPWGTTRNSRRGVKLPRNYYGTTPTTGNSALFRPSAELRKITIGLDIELDWMAWGTVVSPRIARQGSAVQERCVGKPNLTARLLASPVPGTASVHSASTAPAYCGRSAPGRRVPVLNGVQVQVPGASLALGIIAGSNDNLNHL